MYCDITRQAVSIDINNQNRQKMCSSFKKEGKIKLITSTAKIVEGLVLYFPFPINQV